MVITDFCDVTSPCVQAKNSFQIHRVPTKGDTKLVPVTLLILNRFSTNLHHQILQ